MTVHYTDDRVTLHHGDSLRVLATLPDASVDSVVTDPPYALNFMGRTWDRFDDSDTDTELVCERCGDDLAAEGLRLCTDCLEASDEEDLSDAAMLGQQSQNWNEKATHSRGYADANNLAFQRWVTKWAAECMRVLKPGGYLVAFGGSRTWHRLAAGIEDAGFEVRDSIAWMYGSGFPKSRDVSDAMNRWLAGDRQGPDLVDRAIRAIRPGVYEVTAYLRTARDAAGWTNARIDALFGTNGMAGHWTTAGSQPAVPSVRQWGELKKALGFDDSLDALVEQLAANERPEDWGTGTEDTGFLTTLRKDDAYESAGDWGTTLKPAFEPVVVARRPFKGSVTANVLTYGTGALNIAGCSVAMSPEDREKFEKGSAAWAAMSERRGETLDSGETRKSTTVYGDYGNTPSKPRDAGRWPPNVVLDDTQAASLDSQTVGEGAGKYFPIFKYQAKAPTSERPNVDGVQHPTVKPLDLMRWLVRLVTPPGGTVLEPFAGSGTTAEACVIEGFQCVAIEREATYLPLIVQRLTKPLEVALF